MPPVYWYAMSGIMKVFFDRLSDLLTIEKDLGRQLRGKNMAVVSVSNGNNLGDAFWLPFKSTAEYLGMHYIGDLHTLRNIEQTEGLQEFIQNLNSLNI
ncbi:MAG: NAD(P)H-dependent oxidoreductase [Bacteroidia bacterium]